MQAAASQPSSPREAYAARLGELRSRAERQERLFRWMGRVRLACLLAAAALIWLALGPGGIHAAWVLPPAGLFLVLGGVQELAGRRIKRAERAMRFYERGLARLEDRWMGAGETGAAFLDEDHLYAGDLDLFGEGSLFQLLNTARTRAGEAALASWLLAPAAPDEVRRRQQAAAELAPRLDFREKLALAGADVRAGIDPEHLSRWGREEPVHFPSGARPAALLLACLGAGSLIGAAVLGWPLSVPAAALSAELIFAWLLRSKTLRAASAAEAPAAELEVLSEVLSCIEGETFSSPLLKDLRKKLAAGDAPASREIARLERRVEYLEWHENQVFKALSPPLLWVTQFAMAIESWRRRNGARIGGWIEAAGEWEALCSLAAYVYEHPEDPFPELVESGRGLFDAEGLGHPLIPESELVRNDLRVGGDLRLLVVSGSNMSGKSTLLRAAGVNAVLAQAGAPVRARRLRLSPLAVGASIRVVDSLQKHTSRFFQEIRRLRRIVELAEGPVPVFFLLDELLSGTNSHDRRIGAAAVVRELVERGAMGLVTTHDLALTRIVDELSGRAANIHFEDQLIEGRMVFDYRIKQGVVERSNALELMRSIGLDV